MTSIKRRRHVLVRHAISKKDEVFKIISDANIPISYRDCDVSNKDTKQMTMEGYMAMSHRGDMHVINKNRVIRKANKKEIEIYKQRIIENGI